MGFTLPDQKEKENIINNVHLISEKMYKVPSFTDPSIKYTVDMNVGVCECHQGQNGSVCKHQYILWAWNIENTNRFLPFLDATERQKYAEIAIGCTMPNSFYEGIHDRVREKSDVNLQIQTDGDIDFKESNIHTFRSNISPTTRNSSINNRLSVETITTEDCKAELRKALSLLESKIDLHGNDSNFLWGVVKFCDRVEKFPHSRLTTSLHNFGVQSSTSLKVTSTAILNKARKGKIFVQPEAIKRRNSRNGSKNATVKGLNVKRNPFGKEITKKRLHKFSHNVKNLEPVAKKAGSSTASKAKHFTKKNSSSCSKGKLI